MEKESQRMVAWSLFGMWIVLNVLDIVISWSATLFGASEVGLIWQLTGSWRTLAITKLLMALLIGGVLAYSGKTNWLLWLTAGMTSLCIYNGWVLLQQTGGH